MHAMQAFVSTASTFLGGLPAQQATTSFQSKASLLGDASKVTVNLHLRGEPTLSGLSLHLAGAPVGSRPFKGACFASSDVCASGAVPTTFHEHALLHSCIRATFTLIHQLEKFAAFTADAACCLPAFPPKQHTMQHSTDEDAQVAHGQPAALQVPRWHTDTIMTTSSLAGGVGVCGLLALQQRMAPRLGWRNRPRVAPLRMEALEGSEEL